MAIRHTITFLTGHCCIVKNADRLGDEYCTSWESEIEQETMFCCEEASSHFLMFSPELNKFYKEINV